MFPSRRTCFRVAVLAGTALLAGAGLAVAGDPVAGETVFRKCTACHAIGADAGNGVGPHMNELIGRPAGSINSFKYSKAMKAAGENGLVWNAETIDELVANPRKFLKGTKMVFAGLRKETDRADLVAYLATFSTNQATATMSPVTDRTAGSPATADAPVVTAAPPVSSTSIPEHGIFHLGRTAHPEEIAAWDIDIRPDGAGLPAGRGTVLQGEPIYDDNCAVCHGYFGEGVDRWPVLAGGHDTLREERPEKTIGSYWPYLSTVFDYVRRTMPFGDARSLSNDEVYALTAYLLYLNDVVTEEEFELSDENFTDIRLPNEVNFISDDRMSEAHYADRTDVCMTNCKPEPVMVIMRARVLDVTPDNEDSEAVGSVD